MLLLLGVAEHGRVNILAMGLTRLLCQIGAREGVVCAPIVVQCVLRLSRGMFVQCHLARTLDSNMSQCACAHLDVHDHCIHDVVTLL